MVLMLAFVTSLNSHMSCGSADLYEMHATAYILTGRTASGEYTRHGICATGRREWLGKKARIFQRLPDGTVGKELGEYDILDTGCKRNVIDVWCDGIDEAQAFMDLVYEDRCKGKIYVQLIDVGDE